MESTICAIMKGVHHKCTVSVFQWHKHTFHQCKVQQCTCEQYNSMISWCEHSVHVGGWTHEKAKSRKRSPGT